MRVVERVKLDLLKIAVVAAVLFALAFVTAPLFAFRALKAAAQAEDAGALVELVDFPAVRRSLTTQLVPARQVTAEPPSILSDPFGALRRAIEPLKPPEPVVDGYLTPAGLAALSRGDRPGAPPAAKAARPRLRYWDVDRARIAVARSDQAATQTVFTWKRTALFTWKLVHIQLPRNERTGA